MGILFKEGNQRKQLLGRNGYGRSLATQTMREEGQRVDGKVQKFKQKTNAVP